jgi:hypothetical protein
LTWNSPKILPLGSGLIDNLNAIKSTEPDPIDPLFLGINSFSDRILLYANLLLVNKKYFHRLFNDASHKETLPENHPCETQRLLKEHGLFSEYLHHHLYENRHDDPNIQHEFDKRFGLTVVPQP